MIKVWDLRGIDWYGDEEGHQHVRPEDGVERAVEDEEWVGRDGDDRRLDEGKLKWHCGERSIG